MVKKLSLWCAAAVFFNFTNAISAPPASFVISKLVQPRKNIQNIHFKASTMLFNDTDPKNNIVFSENIIVQDYRNYLISIEINKEKQRKYRVRRLIKINLKDREYFIERNYITIKISHNISPLLHLLFSNDTAAIENIFKQAKIDTDVIGLGRMGSIISRIYGAKEKNTYRKSGPALLFQDKSELLENVTTYSQVKPQVWIHKDIFSLTRFISRLNLNNKEYLSDIHFKEYSNLDKRFSVLFPKVVDVYLNERLYARTVIQSVKLNKKIKKSVFNLKTDLKKRTLEKMMNKLSSSGVQIVNFMRLYR